MTREFVDGRQQRRGVCLLCVHRGCRHLSHYAFEPHGRLSSTSGLAQGKKTFSARRSKCARCSPKAELRVRCTARSQQARWTTSYTPSQGLLLMIPNMYKMAGELLPPGRFHVSARTTVATQALNIFGDHSDVMACRQTGFAMLCRRQSFRRSWTFPRSRTFPPSKAACRSSTSSTASAPRTRFRRSVWDYDDLAEMCDMDAVQAFRAHALNPEHPVMRGSHENGDIFFPAPRGLQRVL